MATFSNNPIFCFNMSGLQTQFTNANGTGALPITTADTNGPIRIDYLSVSTTDLAVNTLTLNANDGTNIYPMGSVLLNRAVRILSSFPFSVGTTLTYAATTLTRSTGSWISDGFYLGASPVIMNSPETANNLLATTPITTLTDTVITMSGAAMTARAACYGPMVGLAVPVGTTNLLATDFAPQFTKVDGAGNRFLELPKGWFITASLATAPTSGKTFNVRAGWGQYASA